VILSGDTDPGDGFSSFSPDIWRSARGFYLLPRWFLFSFFSPESVLLEVEDLLLRAAGGFRLLLRVPLIDVLALTFLLPLIGLCSPPLSPPPVFLLAVLFFFLLRRKLDRGAGSADYAVSRRSPL